VRAWLAARSPRDRAVLFAGVGAIALMLAWAYVWHPLGQSRERLAAQVATARTDLAWMRGASAEVQRLRSTATGSTLDRAGKSLLALADSSARDAGLGTALTRIEPVNETRVNVWLERASFDQVATWLESLAQRYGIVADEMSADRVEGVGLANVRVTLVDAP